MNQIRQLKNYKDRDEALGQIVGRFAATFVDSACHTTSKVFGRVSESKMNRLQKEWELWLRLRPLTRILSENEPRSSTALIEQPFRVWTWGSRAWWTRFERWNLQFGEQFEECGHGHRHSASEGRKGRRSERSCQSILKWREWNELGHCKRIGGFAHQASDWLIWLVFEDRRSCRKDDQEDVPIATKWLSRIYDAWEGVIRRATWFSEDVLLVPSVMDLWCTNMISNPVISISISNSCLTPSLTATTSNRSSLYVLILQNHEN